MFKGTSNEMNAAEWINDSASTSAAGMVENMQVNNKIACTSTLNCIGIYRVRSLIMKKHWAAACVRFNTCDVCDRLWFAPTTNKHLPLLKNTFPEEPVGNFKICG